MRLCRYLKLTIATTILIFLFSSHSFGISDLYVKGKNFKVLATQQIHFVPLKKITPKLYNNAIFPRIVDLRGYQSKVKSQGMRGACSYFVITGLVESLIKKTTNREIDLSEEYLAWAAKTNIDPI